MFEFENHIDESASILQRIQLPNIKEDVNVFMKRVDLVHPIISGNKWFKMKYNIEEMKNGNIDTLLTFGGAYSNHIHAAAEAGKMFGFRTVGLIRGEEHLPLNSTLQSAINCGMELHYIDRTKFKERDSEKFREWIFSEFGNVYILPLGGSNKLAVKGCTEIVNKIDIEYDYVCSSAGSGGTFAGIVCGMNKNKKAIAFPALKGGEYLKKIIAELIFEYSNREFRNWELNNNYHFRGFAKLSEELIKFTIDFEKLNGIQLDYIYTNKMMFAIADLIKNGFFNHNETIVAIHSGGIQGNQGMSEKTNKILSKNDETSDYLKHLNISFDIK